MTIKRSVTDFFKEDVPSYASYDNTRKICSYIDGQKISMRKILFTLMDKYPGNEKVKTDTVANITAAYTNYLHGAANLEGVCDTMAQEFVGSNNYPMISGNSSGFGTRINPICAAGRYTKISLADIFKSCFNKADLDICDRQFFESTYIEPKFFMPVFPVLFLNGSHGLSTGFSQDIYPRDPKEIVKYITNILTKKNCDCNLLPWFKGFKGKIKYNSVTQKNECYGIIIKNTMTSYTITEIPIGMEYQKYISILDKMCDDNVIVDYEDLCDTKTDDIKFEIKTTRDFSRTYDTEEKLLSVFKLIKSLPETLCCIDENNKIVEFDSIEDVLNAFINIRLEYYQKRKDYLINKLKHDLERVASKNAFCEGVNNNSIILKDKTKGEIEAQLANIPSIIKENSSYDYLLNMPIHSISKDTLTKLKKEIHDLSKELNSVLGTSTTEMWLDDLSNFMKVI